MASVSIDSDLCVGCKLCVHVCPDLVLGMAGGYVATVLDLSRCTRCLLCEEQCPEQAITVAG
jgi:2-oxoglutarate ferredoxin oxidoreductase subunit delta